MSRREEGVSLLEVLVASLLIGIGLVPLLHLYPDTLRINVESEADMILSAAAVRKSEEIINRLRPPGAIDSVASGTEACTQPGDWPNCRLRWTISTELSSATAGVGQLKTLNVVVCEDRNGNTDCDSGERQVRYDTKITSRP
ncbi:MAG: type IV pilus modification PilV family protein [Armatimonadota bacterium]